jgi:menaquinone-specific isochorismate synthase
MDNRVQQIISKIQRFVQEGCLLQLDDAYFIYFYGKTLSPNQNPIYFSQFFEQPDSSKYYFNDFGYLSKQDLIFCFQNITSFEISNPLNAVDKSTLMTKINADFPIWQLAKKSFFEESFNSIQSLIRRGQIEKAVPVVIEHSSWVPNSLEQKVNLLMNVIKTSTSASKIYAFFDGSSGIIGATPEILFERHGQNLKTMALAGTYPKFNGADPEFLLKSKKDLSEHSYVVQHITEKLQNFGKVIFSQPYIVELPTMWHLKTNIEVQLTKKITDAQLMNLLHPTAALGLYSKILPWQELKDIPHQDDRYWFGSPLGVTLSDNHFICIVCIRNFEWSKNKSRISSGCGIVKESQVDLEWKELKVKRDSVKKMLGI